MVDLAQTYENRKLQNSPKQQEINENQQFEAHLKYSDKLSVLITATVINIHCIIMQAYNQLNFTCGHKICRKHGVYIINS